MKRKGSLAEEQGSPMQVYRGNVLLGIIAVVAIGVATTLALVLFQLITNHP